MECVGEYHCILALSSFPASSILLMSCSVGIRCIPTNGSMARAGGLVVPDILESLEYLVKLLCVKDERYRCKNFNNYQRMSSKSKLRLIMMRAFWTGGLLAVVKHYRHKSRASGLTILPFEEMY